MADVPVRWVSGSQDLIAMLCACAAILLFVDGRALLAGVSLLLALLSKETVALTPVIAMMAGESDGANAPWGPCVPVTA